MSQYTQLTAQHEATPPLLLEARFHLWRATDAFRISWSRAAAFSPGWARVAPTCLVFPFACKQGAVQKSQYVVTVWLAQL